MIEKHSLLQIYIRAFLEQNFAKNKLITF